MGRWTMLLLTLTVGISLVLGAEHIVDMTHLLDSDTIFWPGSPTFKLDIISRGQQDLYWYESNNFSTAEHGGTHLDSPSHFSKNKWRLHEIPLRHLIGPGVVIDISARAQDDPDAQVEIADLEQWEADHGKLPDRAMVLMNSGWGNKWPNKTAVFGTDTVNDSSTFHFPGFSPSAAKWLVDNRTYINAIGVDTPSIDFGQSSDFITHVTMFGANIAGLENVANLDKVPVSGATVFAIPIKLKDGSGGPIRIFAVMNESSAAGTRCITKISVLLIFVLFLV